LATKATWQPIKGANSPVKERINHYEPTHTNTSSSILSPLTESKPFHQEKDEHSSSSCINPNFQQPKNSTKFNEFKAVLSNPLKDHHHRTFSFHNSSIDSSPKQQTYTIMEFEREKKKD
jgi:hypothetical protein